MVVECFKVTGRRFYHLRDRAGVDYQGRVSLVDYFNGGHGVSVLPGEYREVTDVPTLAALAYFYDKQCREQTRY